MTENREILIAEDNSITSLGIQSFFKEKGLNNIKIFESGEGVIKYVKFHKPSIIISDITLEGEIDGIEAMERISYIKKIPFIFITAHPEYLQLIKSYGLSPSKIFIKPFDFSELYSSVKQILLKISQPALLKN
ncbi:MAG: response regulator [Ignavibacteriaceae bacterium]